MSPLQGLYKRQPSNSPSQIVVAPSSQGAWQRHVSRWSGCTQCRLCHTRKQVVLFRGHVPCDVLFIGEAPGASEDDSGYPFVGPAGKLFDTLRHFAWDQYNPRNQLTKSPTWGITNIVACYPTLPPPVEEFEGKTYQLATGRIRAPTRAEADACEPRLVECIKICQPKLIVTLGKEAVRFLPSGKPPPAGSPTRDPAAKAEIINLIHPSAILRMQETESPSAIALTEKRFVLNLANALEKL